MRIESYPRLRLVGFLAVLALFAVGCAKTVPQEVTDLNTKMGQAFLSECMLSSMKNTFSTTHFTLNILGHVWSIFYNFDGPGRGEPSRIYENDYWGPPRGSGANPPKKRLMSCFSG